MISSRLARIPDTAFNRWIPRWIQGKIQYKSGDQNKLSSAAATKNKGNLGKKYGELQCQRQRQSSGSASCSSLLISQDLSFVCGCFGCFCFWGCCRGSG